MIYVDGFLLPAPKKNMKAYIAMSSKAGKIWRKYGALQYVECAGDDLKSQMGLPFPKLVKPKAGETVVFSFIVYKSRAHRDKVNAKVMKDPVLGAMCNGKNMPFDVKRMCYGGFKSIVNA